MIAKYPGFSALNKNIKSEIKEITAKYEPYSDFDFTSLYCWDIEDKSGVSLLNDNLIITLPDYVTGKPTYSILGTNNIDESLDILIKNHNKLNLVPEVVVKHLKDKKRFAVNEDRDNFDYVFELSDLAGLNGSRHRTRRKGINRFNREFESASIDIIRVTDDSHVNEIKALFYMWAVEQDKKPGDVSYESEAIARALDHIDLFSLYLIEISVDGQLAGFSINEILENNWSICHFQKSLLSYKNLDTYLSREVAGFLLQMGCKWVNWEQDLGLHGMRQMKLSYKPDRFLKKYIIQKA